ncbi:MAG: 2-dehydropantoate 2-reductase [Mycobacterium sp.]
MDANAQVDVAVVGVGAVGTALAVALANAGLSVLACDPYFVADRPLAVMRPDGTRQIAECLHVTDPSQVASTVRWIVVATKLQDSAGVSEWLKRLSRAETIVIAAQNGIDHEERLSGSTPGVVVPALIYLNLDRAPGGEVIVRRTGRDIVVPDTAAGQQVASLFSPTDLEVEQEKDFTTAAWGKLLANASVNPLTALTGRTCEVLRDPLINKLTRLLLDETAEVGRAEGAALPAETVAETLAWLDKLADEAKTSMLVDRWGKRELEWEGLTGAVVRAADRHGLAVPATRTIEALLSAVSGR